MFGSRCCAAAIGVAAAVTLAAAPAIAQAPRIGLSGMDPSVSAALGDALEPWGVVVVPLPAEGGAPGASMPGSAERGRALAIAAGAAAVVWLSETPEGWTVWVYDIADDRVLARALLAGPPFDEPTASAVALSIVALLRHGAAAPETERVRAPIALTPGDADPSAPSGGDRSEAAAPGAPGDEARIEIGAGVAAFATAPLDAEPRLALAATFVPAATGGALGVGLVARAGTGVGISTARLSARLHDLQLLARFSGTFTLAGPLLAGVGADVGVRVTILAAVAAGEPSAEVVRAAGIGSAWLALGLDAPPLRVWLRAGAQTTPWPQAYLVRGAQELATEPVWGFSELALEVALR